MSQAVIYNNTGSLEHSSVFAILDLTFIPEPGTALLLGWHLSPGLHHVPAKQRLARARHALQQQRADAATLRRPAGRHQLAYLLG